MACAETVAGRSLGKGLSRAHASDLANAISSIIKSTCRSTELCLILSTNTYFCRNFSGKTNDELALSGRGFRGHAVPRSAFLTIVFFRTWLMNSRVRLRTIALKVNQSDPAKFSVVEQTRDGRRLQIRALQLSDKAEMLAAVGRISAQSLYKRFFGVKRLLLRQGSRDFS